ELGCRGKCACPRVIASRPGLRNLTNPDPSSFRQQSQLLLVSHGLPRDEFPCKHIYSPKEGQIEEKSDKIQVAEDQRPGLSHLVANPLEMDRHLSPMQASSVVMTKMESFVHEVDFIKDRHGMRKVIPWMLRVMEGVLDPCSDSRDEVDAKKRNQHEHGPNSPIVDKNRCEVDIVPRYTPEQASSTPLIAASFEVSVWSNPQNRPNVVR